MHKFSPPLFKCFFVSKIPLIKFRWKEEKIILFFCHSLPIYLQDVNITNVRVTIASSDNCLSHTTGTNGLCLRKRKRKTNKMKLSCLWDWVDVFFYHSLLFTLDNVSMCVCVSVSVCPCSVLLHVCLPCVSVPMKHVWAWCLCHEVKKNCVCQIYIYVEKEREKAKYECECGLFIVNAKIGLKFHCVKIASHCIYVMRQEHSHARIPSIVLRKKDTTTQNNNSNWPRIYINI